LIIIGAGTGMGVGEGVLVNGFVAVADAADSTELRSLWIKGSFATSTADSLSCPLRVHSGAEHVFIWRCWVENLNTNAGTSQFWLGNNTSTDVVQCVFWVVDTDLTGHKGILQRGSSTLNMVSCAVVGCDYVISRYGTNPGASVSITHCLFTGSSGTLTPFQTEGAGVVENSAFLVNSGALSYSGAAGVSYSYCAYGGGASPPGATHIACAPADFVNFQYNDARGGDFHLAEASVLRDAGNPGSPDDLDGSPADIGIYGGQNPYVDGGVPDYPFAVQVKVPYSAPLNGTMRIWGRGRVGPGN
jgi:hypothetical protein